MTLVQYLCLPCLLLITLSSCDSPPDASGNTEQKAAEKLAPQGKVIKAGLFKVIRSGGLVNSQKTSTGKAVSKPVIQQVKTTNRIPLVKDAHMSLQYRIWNLPDKPAYIKLRRVLHHPTMTLPDGSTSTGSDYMINGKVSIGQVIAYTGYGLNEDYEMLEGEWNFQIWLDDRKLIDHTFTTYLPDTEEIAQLGSLSPPQRHLAAMQKQAKPRTTEKSAGRNKNTTAAKRNWLN